MSTVFSIAAVDSTTDQLNIVAHGLNTGDGFLAIYTAAGTYPGGLAPTTDIWAIRVDADHIKVASSSANALANTPIDITSNGSGTLLLLRGLPYRRPRIAAPGSQVFSTDFNDTWLALVALWNLFTGQTQTLWPSLFRPKKRHIAASEGKQISGTAMTESTAGDFVMTTNANNVYRIPIDVDEAERITQVDCRCQSGTTETLTMKLWRQDFSGSSYNRTQIGATANSSSGTANTQTLSIPGLTELPAASFYSYYVEFTCSFVSGASIGMVSVTTDIPVP